MLNPRHIGMCAVLCASSLLGNAYADNMKFAYVNAARVYSESQTAKRIEATLEQEFASRRQQVLSMQQQVLKIRQQLDSNKLKPAERQSLQRQFDELGHQHRVAAGRLMEDYNLRRNEEFASLQRNANDIIQDIATQDQYDLIVQEAVFVRGQYDITDHVIKRLDSGK